MAFSRRRRRRPSHPLPTTPITKLEPARPEPDGPSLASEIGSGVQAEARRWLRWTSWRAMLSAVVLGAARAASYGFQGFGYGAAIGAVSGGVGALAFYLHVSTA